MTFQEKPILDSKYVQALSRHYKIRRILKRILNDDEILLLIRLIFEEKARMQILEKAGYIHPDKKILERLCEKIYGPSFYDDN